MVGSDSRDVLQQMEGNWPAFPDRRVFFLGRWLDLVVMGGGELTWEGGLVVFCLL